MQISEQILKMYHHIQILRYTKSLLQKKKTKIQSPLAISAIFLQKQPHNHGFLGVTFLIIHIWSKLVSLR